MKSNFKPFSLLTLGIGSIVAIFGVTTILNVPISEVSNAGEIRVAATMAKPLAEELQGKPVVVDIYATWCPGCKNIAPTLSRLRQEYGNKAHFVVFDVTDRTTTQAAEAKARQLGLSEFLAANKSQTSMVAIIDPATGMILKQFRNNPNQRDYKAVLDMAISQMAKK